MRARLAVVGSLALAALLAAAPAAAAAPPDPGATPGSRDATVATAPPPAGSVVPDLDPFYAAPADIARYQAGRIVQTRPVNATLLGLPLPVKAWQIAYRTNDSHNAAELAVTTLIIPVAPWTGTGPRPVVSSQTPEDSVGTQCAPSYLLATGTDYQDIALDAALVARGWAVALPDFEGPKSVFLAGPQAGHAVLDGIRAVKRFAAGGITAANPWALDGYSGGAEATGWAAQLQPSYAPDVTLVGAAVGGTPSSPAAVASYIDGGAFAGFEFAAAYGIATEFPEARITQLLNAQGRADFARIKGQCETNILAEFAFHTLAADTSVADPLAVPSVARVLTRNTLGAAAPHTPIYDYHADTDEIVPVGQDNTLVQSWCQAGATVQDVRDLIGEHVEEVVFRMGSVLSFLGDRFANRPATSTC